MFERRTMRSDSLAGVTVTWPGSAPCASSSATMASASACRSPADWIAASSSAARPVIGAPAPTASPKAPIAEAVGNSGSLGEVGDADLARTPRW